MDVATSLQGLILGISLTGGAVAAATEFVDQQPARDAPIELVESAAAMQAAAQAMPQPQERGIENTGPWAVAIAIAGAAWSLSGKVNSALEQGKDAQNLIKQTSNDLREATRTAQQAFEGVKDLQERLRTVQKDIDDLRRLSIENDARIKALANKGRRQDWSISRE